MSATASPVAVGELLRSWRRRRRLSQLDLAVGAEVSARHLSFVETGRSKPSRELLLHLAEHLDVPRRDRNGWLLAAGYAPTFRETPLDAAQMAPVRAALDQVLAAHDPFPAVVVDRGWDLVAASPAASALLLDGVAPGLLAVPNALRISLHPDGLAPRIANFAQWSAHLLDRLARQVVASGDPLLVDLLAELRTYPGVGRAEPPPDDPASALFVPLVLRSGGVELRWFSTVATFGTALDITVAELAIESFFPADEPTRVAAIGRSAVR